MPDHWYAWEMLPGYGAEDELDPYLSPIYVERVKPLKSGKGLLQIGFFNAFYAVGVQGFEPTVKVLRRTRNTCW
jgi:hypothetical protein